MSSPARRCSTESAEVGHSVYVSYSRSQRRCPLRVGHSVDVHLEQVTAQMSTQSRSRRRCPLRVGHGVDVNLEQVTAQMSTQSRSQRRCPLRVGHSVDVHLEQVTAQMSIQSRSQHRRVGHHRKPRLFALQTSPGRSLTRSAELSRFVVSAGLGWLSRACQLIDQRYVNSGSRGMWNVVK